MSTNGKIKCLIVAPSIFAPANISAPMADKVAHAYKHSGNYDVRVLGGILASRIPVIAQLEKAQDLVIYMGHGKADRLCGESPFCDAITISDAHLFKDKIVCAAPACEVGQVLAPVAIQHGAKAFIGAMTSMYGAWPEAEHNYYADWRMYFETLYKGLLTETVGDAVQAYKNKATEFIQLYKSKEDKWPSADWYVNATYVNRDRLEVFGDKYAKVQAMNKHEMEDAYGTIDAILDWFAPPL